MEANQMNDIATFTIKIVIVALLVIGVYNYITPL